MNKKNRDVELTGTTLKVYLYLLSQNKPIGPRALTRALGLSSPSLAYYHLKKLEEMGLVERKSDGYIAVPTAEIKGFIVLGRKLIPRLLFYAMFYLGLLITETIAIIVNVLSKEPISMELLTLTLITGITFTIFLAEGIIAYKNIKLS